MLNDLRYAYRNLRQAPGLGLVIVLTLALGIGANTAIFSVVNRLVFEPLPYPEADKLVAITFDNESPLGFQNWVYAKYQALARNATPFESVASYARANVTVHVSEFPQRVESEIVSATYFPLLRLTAAKGRVFTPDEDRVPGDRAVVVLSDRLWRSGFGADPDVVGKSLTIKNRPYQIVGVMPPSFRGQSGTAELWIPAMMAEHAYASGVITQMASWWTRVIGRLAPGMTIERANQEMPGVTAIVAAQVDAYGSFMRRRDGTELLKILPLQQVKIDPTIRTSFVLLLAAVGFVLLIACANAANLLLGRAVTRHREFAVRRAIGASGRRLARQVVIESLFLALVAGAAAMLVAMWSLDWLTTAKAWSTSGVFAQYARTFEFFDVTLDARALAFNFAVACAVGLLFGVAPAWHVLRTDVSSSLKEGSGASTPGAAGMTGLSARTALVLTEIAFSLILLVAAGLMIRSFTKASTIDLGFDPNGVVTMTYSHTGRKPLAFYEDLLARLKAMPGVERAALSQATPLGSGPSGGPIGIEGRPRGERPDGMADVVSADFFATYRMRIIAGRGFTEADRSPAPRVAVISKALADTVWPGESAIAKKVSYDLVSREWMEVVGVVDRVPYTSLEEEPEKMVWAPLLQPGKVEAVTMAPMTISLRTSLGSAAAAAGVRDILRALEPSAPVFGVTTMKERAAQATSRYRYSTMMMGGMALLALILAATGTYGVMAYSVSSRTREIGIRMALGAQTRDVLRLVLGGGFKMALVGIVLGLAGAFAASRLLTAMLFGVDPGDPLTFIATALLMGLVAVAASYLPARRAMRVDPVVALRRD